MINSDSAETIGIEIKINKTASALLTGVICWTLYALYSENSIDHIGEQLNHHLGQISAILFFLMGAMTIVELVDAYQGFKVITDRINTKDPKKLLWIICTVTFFLSAILDNLTTSIVMVSLIRKLVPNKSMRLFFAGKIFVKIGKHGNLSPRPPLPFRAHVL